MGEIEILGFAKYHKILDSPLHPSIQMKKFELYKSLFYSIGYTANPASVSRWCNGVEYVTNEILNQVGGSPEKCEKHFEDVLKKFVVTQQGRGGILLSSEARAELSDCLKADLLRKNREIPTADDKLLAYALTEALYNDLIRKKVSLDKKFEAMFEKKRDFCMNNDIPLNTPFILSILMENEEGAFLPAYRKACSQRVDEGVAQGVLGSICKYAASTKHGGTYLETREKNRNLLFWAKKYACLDNRESTCEIDIVKALFLINSRTIEHLAEITGGKENLIREMERERGIHSTTDL